jgi:hypothetical protein
MYFCSYFIQLPQILLLGKNYGFQIASLKMKMPEAILIMDILKAAL